MLEEKETCGHIKDGWCFQCIALWSEAYSKGMGEALNKKTGYMCSTDYHYELGSAEKPSQIYSSVEDLKKHKKCWSDCGIIEVEISIKKIIV